MYHLMLKWYTTRPDVPVHDPLSVILGPDPHFDHVCRNRSVTGTARRLEVGGRTPLARDSNFGRRTAKACHETGDQHRRGRNAPRIA